MSPRLAPRLFALDPRIRYVAVNRAGAIAEMEQAAAWPTSNAHETDRMEELIVNPVVLEAVRRRGNLDLQGVRHVTIRYGTLYQVVVPIEDGHVSVGVEPSADVERIAGMVEEAVTSSDPSEDSPFERALRLALPRGLH
jgi:hypothetical protein